LVEVGFILHRIYTDDFKFTLLINLDWYKWFQIVLYTSNWVYPDEVNFYYSSIWIDAHNSKLHQVDFWCFQVQFDHQAGFIMMLSNFTYADNIKLTELIKLDLYWYFQNYFTHQITHKIFWLKSDLHWWLQILLCSSSWIPNYIKLTSWWWIQWDDQLIKEMSNSENEMNNWKMKRTEKWDEHLINEMSNWKWDEQLINKMSNWNTDEVNFYYSSVWIHTHSTKLHQVDFMVMISMRWTTDERNENMRWTTGKWNEMRNEMNIW